MSDLKVLDFNSKTERQPSNPEVIQRLEEALAMAKDGGVKTVAIIAILDNGDIMDCWANGGQPYALVGGIEAIKHDFINQTIEAR